MNIVRLAVFLELLNLYKLIEIVYILAFLFAWIAFCLKNGIGNISLVKSFVKKCVVLILIMAALKHSQIMRVLHAGGLCPPEK